MGWIRFEDMDSLRREEILAEDNCCFWPSDGYDRRKDKPLSIGRHEEDAEVCAHVLLNLGKYYFVQYLDPGIFKHRSAYLAWSGHGEHVADFGPGFDDLHTEAAGVALSMFHDNLDFWTAYFDLVYDEFERRLDCLEMSSGCFSQLDLHWNVEALSKWAPNTVDALRPHVKERLGRLFVKAQCEVQVAAPAFLEMDTWGTGSGFFAHFEARKEEIALIHEYLLERDALREAAEIAEFVQCEAGEASAPRRRASSSL